MFSNFDVLINYPEAMRQAERIKKISSWCESMGNDIGREAKKVETMWQGMAGASVKGRLDYLKKQNQKVVNDLNMVAQKIENAAKEIQEADIVSTIRIRQIDE